MDFAETLFIHRAFEQLKRGVAPVLLDDKQAHVGFITGFHHGQAILPAGGHGFFRHHMLAVTSGQNGLLRMQARRRADGYQIAVGFAEHGFIVPVAGDMVFFRVFGQYPGVLVADGHQFKVFRVFFNGTEVVFRYAPAADHSYFYGAIRNGGKHGDS